MNTILILAIIFTLPYNNFPYGVGGTLTPLSLIPIFFFNIYIFFSSLLKGYLRVNKAIFFIFLAFIVFILLTILDDIYFYDFFISQKITSPIFITLQFIIYSFISIGSLISGYFALKYYKSIDKILKFILYAYMPSLMFGILELILNNHHLLNVIRSFFASTKFPDGYYRIYLLTTEPSWASFDLVTFILPISLYLFYKKRNFFYLLIFFITFIILIFIKSLLGFITISLSIFILLILFFRKLIFNLKIFIPIVGFTFLFFVSIFFFKDIYIERLNKVMHWGDSSSITRIITYFVSIEVFKAYPFIGVGFRNSGYFYPQIVSDKYPELLSINLISDWSDYYSKRFPYIKSTFFEILSSAGIIGILTLIIFLLYILMKIKSFYYVKKVLFSYIIIASLIGSFSMILIGYPIFWFICGIIISYKERRIYR
jgi:O-antigen ligase